MGGLAERIVGPDACGLAEHVDRAGWIACRGGQVGGQHGFGGLGQVDPPGGPHAQGGGGAGIKRAGRRVGAGFESSIHSGYPIPLIGHIQDGELR